MAISSVGTSISSGIGLGTARPHIGMTARIAGDADVPALMGERMMRMAEDLFRKSIDAGYSRRFTAGQLVDGWTRRVHRLSAEALQSETGQTWGIDDFVGALQWPSILAFAVRGAERSCMQSSSA